MLEDGLAIDSFVVRGGKVGASLHFLSIYGEQLKMIAHFAQIYAVVLKFCFECVVYVAASDALFQGTILGHIETFTGDLVEQVFWCKNR